MSRHPLFPALAVVLGAAVWGLYWLPQRGVAGDSIGGGWATAVLNAPAFLMAVLIALRFRAWRQAFRPGILSAGACFGAGFACYAMALVETSVLRATILFYLTPVWGTILGILILGEASTVRRWLAIGLALPGLVLILGLGSGWDDGLGVGEALGLFSGFIWAFGAVSVRRAKGMPVAALGFAQYGSVVVISVVLALVLGQEIPSASQAVAALTPGIVLYALLALAAFYVIFWAMAFLSPGRSGLMMMSEVVVAAISAAILLPEEALGALEWVGAGLILAAAVVEVSGTEEDACPA